MTIPFLVAGARPSASAIDTPMVTQCGRLVHLSERGRHGCPEVARRGAGRGGPDTIPAVSAAPRDPAGEDDRALLEAAREASTRAHAPYSRFPVGAAVRTERGAVYRGCNVENASYGLTCCAERAAIFAAVAAEGPGMRVRDVAVYADAHSVPPCGACRQVIAEFGPRARVIFPSSGAPVVMRLDDLLPERFEFRP